MSQHPRAFFAATEMLAAVWPENLLGPLPDLGPSHIYFGEVEYPESDHPFIRCETLLRYALLIPIPGLEGTVLILGTDASSTRFYFEIEASQPAVLRVSEVPLTLQIGHEILRCAEESTDAEGHTVAVEAPGDEPILVQLGKITVGIDFDGNMKLDLDAGFNLPLCLIGDTGIALDASDVRFYGGGEPAPLGQSAGWRGLTIDSAKVILPGSLGDIAGVLMVNNASIGAGGFTGDVAGSWMDQAEEYRNSGELFGIAFRLDEVEIGFVQNSLRECSVRGAITLPFFDKTLAVDVGIGLDGSLSLEITGADEDGDEMSDDGLLILRQEGVFTVEVESLGFEVRDGRASVLLSGLVTPEIAGLDLPGFRVDELEIDSEGNVHLDGGWLDLPEQYSIDFHGFQFEVTRLGLGNTDEGERWIGLNGSLKLVEALPAGASVEGLRIGWNPTTGESSLSFGGIGVELEVPDAFRFKGTVAYLEEGDQHRFVGAVTLEILALDLQLDAQLVFGTAPGYSYFGIYLGANLPTGIPLFTTGLSIYGMAGLLANNMEPDKKPDEPWYGTAPGEGWYKRPEPGVTDLAGKWVDQEGSFAFGAGVTIGTATDNGYAFSGEFLLAIVLPGPIVMLEGKANIQKQRAALGEEAPNFRALVVLDNRAGTLQAGLDARYRFDEKDGSLLDIRGSIDAFFSYSDPTAWHLYLGQKEPREKRIAAEVFGLFEATSYYMVDAQSLAFGAGIGFDERYSLGPLSVSLKAQIEGGARLNWMPPHFHGAVLIEGAVSLKIFGFGLGLSASAEIAADVFDPFLLKGDFRVSIDLPWPLSDVSKTVTLQWGPEPGRPLIPLPVREIALEHLKVSTTWPLPRGQLLLPDFEHDGGYLNPDVIGAAQAGAPPPLKLPVVPLDVRPSITFTRPINDTALVGVTQLGNEIWEQIGDPVSGEGPVKVRYQLTGLSLDVWLKAEGQWKTAASADAGAATAFPDARSKPSLFGAWAAVPPMDESDAESANTKLVVWSKNPFDMARFSGRGWEESFSRHARSYPCMPEIFCYDFSDLPTWLEIEGVPVRMSTWTTWGLEGEPIDVIWGPQREAPRISSGYVSGLTFPAPPENLPFLQTIVILELPRQFFSLRVRVSCKGGGGIGAFDTAGTAQQEYWQLGQTSAEVVLTASEGKQLGPFIYILCPSYELSILEVCGTDRDFTTIDETTERAASHMVEEAQRWKFDDVTLAPHATYRLAVTTQVTAKGEGSLDGKINIDRDVTEYAYFRTEGPPGLTRYSAPAEHPASERFDSGLDNLSAYVRQTLPRTIPERGNDALLPKPVYRAYDLGIAFNENYVDRLYDGAGRGLSLRIFDANSEPVRGITGELLLAGNRWGNAETLFSRRSDRSWLSLLRRRDCIPVEASDVRHAKTIALQGTVLPADRLLEARLVPLLLSDTFGAPPVGVINEDLDSRGFRVISDAGMQGEARWEIRHHPIYRGTKLRQEGDRYLLGGLEPAAAGRLAPGADVLIIPSTMGRPAQSHRITKVVSIEEGAVKLLADPDLSALPLATEWLIPEKRELAQTEIVLPSPANPLQSRHAGTMLLYDGRGYPDTHDPADWSDYRVEVALECALAEEPRGDAAIGVIFRARKDSEAHHYYHYLLTPTGRELIWVNGYRWKRLASDEEGFEPNRRYQVAVEVVGPRIRIFQDDLPVFDVVHEGAGSIAPLLRGSVGMSCVGTAGTRFGELRVHDLNKTAEGVYSFKLITSRFANFFHHLHSYQDKVWRSTIARAALPEETGTPLENITSTVVEAEACGYGKVAQAVLGPARHENVSSVEITRVEDESDSGVLGWLVRSPEPFDWPRISLTLSHASEDGSAPATLATPPNHIKIVNVEIGAGSDQPITLLLRESCSLSGHRIEYRRSAPDEAAPADAFVPTPGFENPLLREDFTTVPDGDIPNDWRIVDEPPYTIQQSRWLVENGMLRQTSNIYGFSGGTFAQPGTYLVGGDSKWTDYRVSVILRSTDNDAIGVIFRHQDPENFLRFSMDRERGYRRLVRKVRGATHLLWEDHTRFECGRAYTVTIDCVGKTVEGWIDGVRIFSVHVVEPSSGQVGLYARANIGAYFHEIRVNAPFNAWVPYHDFQESTPLAAGTRVQLHALTNTVIADEAGLVHRTRERDALTLPFPTQGIDLRVVDDRGNVLHARSFRSKVDSLLVERVTLLRKADGTEFFLTAPSVHPNAAHQLELSYQRDNRAIDPGSEVYTQAGYQDEERAHLYLPVPHTGPITRQG